MKLNRQEVRNGFHVAAKQLRYVFRISLSSFGKIEELSEDKQNIQIPAKFVTKSKCPNTCKKKKKNSPNAQTRSG